MEINSKDFVLTTYPLPYQICIIFVDSFFLGGLHFPTNFYLLFKLLALPFSKFGLLIGLIFHVGDTVWTNC